MLIDNYSHPFVATTISSTTEGNFGLKLLVGMRRNMNMGQKTPGPLPMWQTTVSHIVPNEWLGNLHGENRCRTLVRGYCGCYGEVKERKQAAEGFFVLTTNVLKH